MTSPPRPPSPPSGPPSGVRHSRRKETMPEPPSPPATFTTTRSMNMIASTILFWATARHRFAMVARWRAFGATRQVRRRVAVTLAKRAPCRLRSGRRGLLLPSVREMDALLPQHPREQSCVTPVVVRAAHVRHHVERGPYLGRRRTRMQRAVQVRVQLPVLP